MSLFYVGHCVYFQKSLSCDIKTNVVPKSHVSAKNKHTTKKPADIWNTRYSLKQQTGVHIVLQALKYQCLLEFCMCKTINHLTSTHNFPNDKINTLTV